jgi:hypothetical protein
MVLKVASEKSFMADGEVNVQAERSRLLNRQKKERSDLEKEVKKKKGAMKAAAEAQLEEMELSHTKELQEFDEQHGSGKQQKETSNAPQVLVVSKKLPTDIEWNDLSKKELQEECALRGLSKGGGREELVTRLICWAAEVKASGAEPGEGEENSEESDHSSDDDSVSDSDDEDDIPDMTDEQRNEAEKQYKRELIVRKAILHLFESKFPEGFLLEDLPEYLARIKVVNFKPESLGYSSLHEFARKQPREAIFYDKGHKMLKPVHLRSDKRGTR